MLFNSRKRKIHVKETRYKGEDVIILFVNGATESAVFCREELRDHLVFDYLNEFNRVFSMRDSIKETLILGGAGCTFPRFVRKNHPEVKMDICEIDPLMIDLARKFFYFDSYDKDKDGEIIIEDAFTYIKNCKKKYHAVFHDAYTEDFIEKSLLNERGIIAVKNILHPGGIYAVNYITALTGMQSMQGIMARESLKQYFKNVSLFPCNEKVSSNKRQNCIILASDGEIK